MAHTYHRDHGHEADLCRSLKFLVEKLIKAGHLRRYLRDAEQGVKSGQPTDRVIASLTVQVKSRPTINYILGGQTDDRYQSKFQQKKFIKAATVKARVNVIHTDSGQEAEPIDGPISCAPINLNRVIVLHYDALVLTLYINGFDVHRVLQLLAFILIKLSPGVLNLAENPL